MAGPENQVKARNAIERLKELRAADLLTPDQAYWAEQTEVLVQSASGWLARAQGDDAGALRFLRSAADLEDGSEKHVAMEHRIFPVREQLGYLLLELGKPGLAGQYQEQLRALKDRATGSRTEVKYTREALASGR